MSATDLRLTQDAAVEIVGNALEGPRARQARVVGRLRAAHSVAQAVITGDAVGRWAGVAPRQPGVAANRLRQGPPFAVIDAAAHDASLGFNKARVVFPQQQCVFSGQGPICSREADQRQTDQRSRKDMSNRS